MQNNVISIRITSLYWDQPSFVVFVCKTATLVPELQVSMRHRLHQWIFAFKTATLAPELRVSMGPSPHLWFCAFTTATLWPELKVSMSPRPHLSFFASKNCVIRTRMTLVYWLQLSSVVLGIEKVDFSIRPTRLYGCQPSFVGFACKTACLAPELLVSMAPRPHLSFCACKTTWLASESLVSMGPSPHLWYLHAKQRL